MKSAGAEAPPPGVALVTVMDSEPGVAKLGDRRVARIDVEFWTLAMMATPFTLTTLGFAPVTKPVPRMEIGLSGEPTVVDELQMELSDAVGAAVDFAVAEVRRLLAEAYQ